MNTAYGVNAYMAHDLNMSMRTSSGDEITLDFKNHKSASYLYNKTNSGEKGNIRFSSMHSFQFSIKSNGISKQDQKEIDAFMKTAQPFIDSFTKELEQDAPKSPVTKLAHKIASIFQANKPRSENTKNHIKSSIVDIFDKSVQKLDKSDSIEKIIESTKKLLEKTLKEFDNFNKVLYA